ncbi:hypothetical protein RRG08_057032 [Elysia crispata]|uniref:Uncharacterized protein n=1 Tax=Elysia crispata TaxID=231223 RepID=A0AAE0Z662_9GAST|nr:hypothetical protein RRG08_057032 [Elysia crispata]
MASHLKVSTAVHLAGYMVIMASHLKVSTAVHLAGYMVIMVSHLMVSTAVHLIGHMVIMASHLKRRGPALRQAPTVCGPLVRQANGKVRNKNHNTGVDSCLGLVVSLAERRSPSCLASAVFLLLF